MRGTRVRRALLRPFIRLQRHRRPLILMYHRIGASGQDPWGISVSGKYFEEQLDALRGRRKIIGLSELAAQLRRSEMTPDSAVITFDDGYADNLHHAKPLLERYGFPATIFVTSSAIGRKTEFYWDELERILLQPGRLPSSLRLEIDGAICDWDLAGSASFGENEATALRNWHVWTSPPTERHALYLDLWRRLRPLEESVREHVVEQLRSWAGAAIETRPDRRLLTADELVSLAAGGLVEIGAHSLTHATLPGRSRLDVDREVEASKNELQRWLGRPVESFAYPYGDFDDVSVAAVREAGFALACGTAERAVRKNDDLFRLPRIHVHDWCGEEFDRRLAASFVA